ncbi:UDP-N-acetylglucosamine 2-epimerase (hydrolyzing) [Heliorestis acidaminivorans]|uniref:UDP-N-acetylglucosamine 2-epimerase (Hydrolyzing) n=1 Tax=Heliorestis acidaminivorans TaxID=553427 RepID=A0A6I0F468_9FIRM|nr:UDP-N-acetylglucosamine 2-epimerase [Heliorestis acidaminivorans]KAB2953622.1 UDP-N-acetylglucosamine 2-epimerase (hydrolyzing) [Heliorestis acidaminivorans]
MEKRKICIVTGTRADYGLLYGLLHEIKEDPDLELQLIVTGMHLSPEFGLTYQKIEQDGFTIDAKVEMLLSSDTTVGITKSIGLGLIGFAEALDRLRPDIVVVLGDRFEILAPVQSALVARIPVAHIHGGETTEGCIDESIRHAITKMAQLHFTSTEQYRQRVIQMGEHPEKVYNFGTPGLENIRRMKLHSKDELEKELDFQFGKTTFLVTFHPVTLNKKGPEQAVESLLKALDQFPEAKIIFTMPNADTDGRVIIKKIQQYESARKDRVKAFTSLGQIRYLSTIKYVDAVLGNSSSGLIEVPYFQKPTVNIGDRQKGRLCASSVINCAENSESIQQAIEKALSKDFQKTLESTKSPYGTGEVSKNTKEILKRIDLTSLLRKPFFDLIRA